MPLTLLHPLTKPENFAQETFVLEEWERNGVPGHTYSSYNYLGTRTGTDDHTAHWGFDMRGEYGDPIYSPVNGVTKWKNDMSLGQVLIIVDDASDLQLWFCHTSWRVPAGVRVKAGQEVARVGTSGGVPAHLHFTVTDERGYGYFHNPMTALNDCKEELMLSPEAVKQVRQAAIDAANSASAFTAGHLHDMFANFAKQVESTLASIKAEVDAIKQKVGA